MLHKIIILIVALSLSACGYHRNAQITIKNESGTDIYDVLVSGNGFHEAIAKIEAGKSHTIKVGIDGESGLTMKFRTSSGVLSKDDLAYIESGYCVDVTIHKKFDVTSEGKIKCFW